MSAPYDLRERIDRLEAALVKVVAERDALRRLLVEVDGYLMCVEDHSMSRNNAEALASELRAAIAEKL